MIASTGERLELDFFIEDLSVAVEVQGKQHYVFTTMFHKDYNDFLNRVRLDSEKSLLCLERSIKLMYISSDVELVGMIQGINSLIPEEKFIPDPAIFSKKAIAARKKKKKGKSMQDMLETTRTHFNRELAKDHPNQDRTERLQQAISRLSKSAIP